MEGRVIWPSLFHHTFMRFFLNLSTFRHSSFIFFRLNVLFLHIHKDSLIQYALSQFEVLSMDVLLSHPALPLVPSRLIPSLPISPHTLRPNRLGHHSLLPIGYLYQIVHQGLVVL